MGGGGGGEEGGSEELKKTCSRCKKSHDSQKYAVCDPCRAKCKVDNKARYEKMKEEEICTRCRIKPGMIKKRRHFMCLECTQESDRKWRKWRDDVYQGVIDQYGGKCACCGETSLKFLTIDHINNDGYKEKGGNKGNRGGYSFYKRIRDNHRDDLQVLCYNCNCGRHRNGGVCPHMQEGEKSYYDCSLVRGCA